MNEDYGDFNFHEGLCVVLQGIYAVVQFTTKDSVRVLKANCTIPSVQHEAAVPFKSRLLSLKSTGQGGQSNASNTLKLQKHLPVPVSDLTQHLSKQDSVSYLFKNVIYIMFIVKYKHLENIIIALLSNNTLLHIMTVILLYTVLYKPIVLGFN